MIRQVFKDYARAHSQFRVSKAFTIVEVIIVIVVIAILATIAGVAYNGITDNTKEVSVKSDLSGTADKIAAVKYRTGSYPASLTNDTLVQSSGNVLNYQLTSAGFCLQGRNTQSNKDTRLFITQDNKITSGLCPVTYTQVVAGNDFSCGLAPDGRAYCWGVNTYGQLGDGTTTTRLAPVPVAKGAIPNDVTVTQLTAGTSHACALGSDRKVYCWGSNSYRQLGDGTTTQRLTPVQIANGAMPSGTLVDRVTAGGSFSCMVANEAAYCWGDNGSGQLGDGTTTSRSTPVLVLQGDQQASDPPAMIKAGGSHVCGIPTDGSIYCWGLNSSGQLGDGTTVNRTSPVRVLMGASPESLYPDYAIGNAFSCFYASSSGSAYCWGDNTRGQLGDGTTTNRSAPVLVQRGAMPVSVTVQKIAAGYSHACVVGSDNRPYCWGYNYGGQLGDGTTTNRPTPVAVSQGAIVPGVTLQQLSGGTNHTCALASDKTVYCWGINSSGSLGDGSNVNRSTPVLVVAPLL